MSAVARLTPMPPAEPEQAREQERRFQPSPEALEDLLQAARPWVEPCVYDRAQPIAYTRTTYFDTEGLHLLGTGWKGPLRRLRLREYAGAADLSRPAVLTGQRYLELKESAGTWRSKVRHALSEAEAEALLRGMPLPEGSLAAWVKQAASEPVRPWVTAWYRRSTYASREPGVRLTLDEELLFALPPRNCAAGQEAKPLWRLGQAPSVLLEVKWRGPTPPWLEQVLRGVESFAATGTKFERGMSLRLAMAAPQPSPATPIR